MKNVIRRNGMIQMETAGVSWIASLSLEYLKCLKPHVTTTWLRLLDG